MALKFVSLHNHTGASVYDGLGRPKDLAEWMLKNAGEDSGAFAITNHGNMNDIGYQAEAQRSYDAKGAPVKMIYGVEAYFVPDLAQWRRLKDEKDVEKKAKKKAKKEEGTEFVIENEEESKAKKFLDPFNRRHHLVVCAYNQAGLSNIFRLVSRSYREGFYRKPRIDTKILEDCNEGLMVSTACIAGLPAYCTAKSNELNLSQEERMCLYENELGPLMDIFGEDRFFLELQFNKIPEQTAVNTDLCEFSQRTGYKLIATADCHYPEPDMWKDRELYRLLGWQMQKGDTAEKMQKLNETERKDLDCELYLKNGDQMYDAFLESPFFDALPSGDHFYIREAIERTYDIAHSFVEKVYPDAEIKLPKTFQVTEKIKTGFDQLKTLCLDALKKKGLSEKKEYVDRAIYELKIIRNLGVSEYFLTEAEIVKEMKKYGLMGPARGSGAGSLVNYLLGITLIDPLRYGLIFERFMSPSRKEMPDIDQDFEAKDKALEILKDRFGEKNVLAISTYNRLQLKSLIKDISRLYGVPFSEVNKVTKLAEQEAKPGLMEEVGNDQKLYEFTFEGAKKYSGTFREFIKKYPQVGEHIKNLFQEVKAIGKHAGGVLIVPGAEGHVPILKLRGVEQSPMTEGITAQHLQQFGLVKFDVLGVATLKVIRRAIEIILREQGIKKPTIDDVWAFYDENLHPDVINIRDPKIFENVYTEGNFPSIFQFTKRPVQRFCTEAKPEDILDLAAITSIWRPGALKAGGHIRYLGMVDESNQRKFKQEHPVLQEVLKDTRGVLCYQEQFQLLAHKLAGFSLEDADKLRKLLVKPATSLSKELQEERLKAGEDFIEGCVKKGMDRERAEKLWHKEIMGYVSYGFNKSHAVSYSFNSYHCAWLYTYHERAWIKACLECDPDPQETLHAVRGLGYDVEKPDVNASDVDEWTIQDDKTCVPALTSLKGVGVTGAQELVKSRPENGFTSLHDFFYDGDEWRYSKLNKKCLTALMRMDAFRNIPGAIGPSGVFKNHAHFERAVFGEVAKPSAAKKGALVTYEIQKLLKANRITLEEAALESDDTEWTVPEKIEFQKEIVGFYDKSLVVGRYLPVFAEFNIDAIDQVEDDTKKSKVWAVVDDVTQRAARNGNPYVVVKASGVTEKTYTFKVWKTSMHNTPFWIPGNIVIFSLEYSEDWGYSLPPGSKIMKVNK